MKKLLSSLLSVVMIACALLTSFFALGKVSNVAYATDDEQPTEFIPGYVLSQSGYIFSQKDFEVSGERYLYVNTTITITKKGNSDNALVWWRNMDNSLIQQTALDHANDNVYFSYAGVSETKTRVQITYYTNNGNTATQFNFILIQTPLHFSNSVPFAWKNNIDNTIVAPTAAQPYADRLSLTGLSGTENCPIYIDLYFNGEFYGLYNNGIGYYNRITGNQVDATDLNFTAAGRYKIYIYDKTVYGNIVSKSLTTQEYNNLKENITYNYFDTKNSNYSSHANIKYYAFEIRLSSSSSEDYWMKNMYITASDTNGNDIAYSQTVNDAVYLNFYNITASKVAKIVLTIYHTYSSGNNIPETIVLAKNPSEINKLMESGLYFDDDGNYTIAFFDAYGNCILPAYDESTGQEITDPDTEYDSQGREVVAEVPFFKFNILTSIKVQYRGNSAYGLDKNTIETRTIKEVAYRWYVGLDETNTDLSTSFVMGINSNEYTLQLANPDVKIEGVTNGATVSDSVTLEVNGVGEISVVVTKDNTTTTYKLPNGSRVPGTNEIGSYTIRIKDQMGNEASVSFTISQSFNMATVALFVIAAAILGISIFLIVRLRTRIKVR